MNITDEQYNLLLKSIQGCRDDIARVDRDLTEDRKENQRLTLRVGAVENQLTEIVKMWHTMQNKVKDKVEIAIKPLVEVTNDLTEAIENNSIPLPKIKKRKWLLF
jgi:chromosome segregation ATPase